MNCVQMASTNAEADVTLVFCYGSNGVEQVRERVENPAVTAHAASVRDWVRVFAGFSKRWNGGVASIVAHNGGSVFGSVVALTHEEIRRMDVFEGVDSDRPTSTEGVYRHEYIDVSVRGQGVHRALAYVKNDLTWRGPPSTEYLRACKRNIEQFWTQPQEDGAPGAVTITVRKGDGTVVSEWEDESTPLPPAQNGVRWNHMTIPSGEANALDVLANGKRAKLFYFEGPWSGKIALRFLDPPQNLFQTKYFVMTGTGFTWGHNNDEYVLQLV